MTEGCLLHHGPLHAAEPYNLVASQSEEWEPKGKGTNGECRSEGETWMLSCRVAGVRPCWKAEEAGIWYPWVMTAAIQALTREEQSSAHWLLPSLALCPTGAPSLQRHWQKCHPISSSWQSNYHVFVSLLLFWGRICALLGFMRTKAVGPSGSQNLVYALLVRSSIWYFQN